MRRKMLITVPQIVFIVLITILITTISVLAATGTTDSSNAPGLSTSYTLEDIYVRLVNGTAGSQSTFNEPAVAPGTGSMQDLNDIMAAAPAQDNTNGATAAEVQAGNTFWSLTNGEWGPQTGQRHGGCVCEGHMAGDNGFRWCDNGDGTITDMYGVNGEGICLVWLQDAGCLGTKPYTGDDNAFFTTRNLHDGQCSLTDSSNRGDWRLPTHAELAIATSGWFDIVTSSSMQGFTNVAPDFYWTMTPGENAGEGILSINLQTTSGALYPETESLHVWAVRSSH